MHGFRHDLRYALRALLKTPGFSVIAVLTLALGIGGTTAIFTLVNALLLKPLPFKDPSHLMMVHLKAPDPRSGPGIFREMVWSYPKYQALKANQRSFEDLALFMQRDWNITGTDEPERVRGEIVDSRYLSVLGITPQLGRDIRADEDQKPGVAAMVLISYGFWQHRFGGDPQVVGR